MKQMASMGPGMSDHWAMLRKTSKESMRSEIRSINSLSEAERIRELERILGCNLVGPFGSYEYDMPFNVCILIIT